jgi:hypothetical protein
MLMLINVNFELCFYLWTHLGELARWYERGVSAHLRMVGDSLSIDMDDTCGSA